MTEEDPGGEAIERIARLERRVQREREAREQAERIAEHGMRDLWQTNRGLEERVAERTAELQRSLAAATMAAEAKERFLAELGHDLTTPLHAVLGLLELIDETVLDPADQGRVDEVQKHAMTLSELLRGLVDLAGAEGAPAPADLEVNTASAWLDALVDEWTRPAAMNGQLLVPSVAGGEREFTIDWTRLTKIVGALLSNAVRHGSPGTIDVAAVVAPHEIEVTVGDSGPGMSTEERITALEPFVRHGDGTGIGIGLSVAHRLALGASGTLELASDGERTRVTVRLPHST